MQFSKCLLTGRFFYSSDYPKKCNCCSLVYWNRDEYLKKTFALETGKFGAPKKNKILEYRNCICGSTLVIKFKDERDYSPKGCFKRDWIGEKIHQLIAMGQTYHEAKTKAIKEFNELD